jgi:hypothetical protein
MGNCHLTRLFCHSSTVVDFKCYLLQAIFRWLHIGASSSAATVRREGWPGGYSKGLAGRILLLRPPGSS